MIACLPIVNVFVDNLYPVIHLIFAGAYFITAAIYCFKMTKALSEVLKGTPHENVTTWLRVMSWMQIAFTIGTGIGKRWHLAEPF